MEKNKKESNINLMLIGLIIVLLISSITIWGYILLRNQLESNPQVNPKTQTIIREKDNQEQEKEGVDMDADLGEFELSFLKLENKGKNNIYSPLSIKYALYLLRDGANGETLTQIENIIGKETDVKKYENIEDKLSFANSVYIKESFQERVKKAYIENVKNRYNAEINYDKFESAKNVNDWIDRKTFGQIKNVLNDNQVTNADVILINALAIDMKWKNQFAPENTQGKAFFLSDGSKMQATTLYQETRSDDVSYYKDDDVTALCMDLEDIGDNKLSFMAVMPNEENLSEYVKDFKLEDLEKIESNLKLTSEEENKVQIYIPKFEYDYELNFKDDLIALGLGDIFKANVPDFTNITDDSMWVTDAIHKANIEFKEEGTKAAAVTVFTMKANGMAVEKDYKPIVVDINKPFLYFIKDKESGEIWFVGTLYEPSDWQEDKADYNK